MEKNIIHIPVMLKEVTDELVEKNNKKGVYIDCTLGSGGHTKALLEKYQEIEIIAFDQDSEAIKRCKKLTDFKERIIFINDNFSNFEKYLTELKIEKVNGFLLDLGLSSEQILSSRFSYWENGKLDMRMNQKQELNAWKIVNEWSFEELKKIFLFYGEELNYKIIAEKIIEARKRKTINTNLELVEIIKKIKEKNKKKEKKHPARKIFQALRIAVNEELSNLLKTIEKAPNYLEKKGVILVISYHSLEDRITKKVFNSYKNTCQVLNLKPTEEEIELNHCSRSAKMRIMKKIN